MSKKLIESDIYVTTIHDLFKNTNLKDNEEASTETADSEESTEVSQEEKATSSKDWGKILEKRLETNKKRDPEARIPEAEIENKFWIEYFSAYWKEPAVKKLFKLELLKDDIKKLGFDPQLNPLIAFFKIDYVQKELLLTGLINSNTFKAIHNAIARRYIADSELMTPKNYYNIIYCRDLYSKPLPDMLAYLEAQSYILNPKASSYNKTTLSQNIRIFLQPGQTSTQDSESKLNSLEDIKSLLKTKGIEIVSDNSDDKSPTKGNKLNQDDLTKIVKNLTSPVAKIAALHYLSIFASSDTTQKAFKTAAEINKGISINQLSTYNNLVTKQLKNIKYGTDADSLAELILQTLDKKVT